MIMGRVFDLLLKATQAEEKILHSEAVIRILKALNIDPEQPPAGFDGIYAYALVEYAYDTQGNRKHSALIRLFRTETVKDGFRKALSNDAPREWLDSVSTQVELGDLGRELRELGYHVEEELIIFARFFFEIVKRSRLPKEIVVEQKLDSLQKQMQQMQLQMQQLPLCEIQQSVTQLVGTLDLVLPAAESSTEKILCRAASLADQLKDWFSVLGYGFEESHEVWTEFYFEFLITIPVRRKRYDRIVVRGIDGEADLADVQALNIVVEEKKADEGWLISNRRVSPAARSAVTEKEEYKSISCYTFDELLDEDANFENYIAWLEEEITAKNIKSRYVSLACTKAEVDPVTKQRIGVSHYGKEEGWIDVYVDQWLDDPAKEHLSVLGEFGSGKTWFALHYAWLALEEYKKAQQRGTERPRLPLVIPLRDYAKSVNAESLFSEFFFRKHEIPLPGYSAFEQLNRMGKLLLIFDGFDEMAARVDRQAMVNNFWELAKVVVPGSKAILTCRTEHFPEAQESRRLLNAELRASTRELTGETPQFEVLELEKFSDEQIREVLVSQTSIETLHKVMSNPQLIDLARRPVLTEMIVEALPDIEAGKPIDMSRIYLYAVCNKMERDITSERTFTSMTDKLYFLCELSWEMLSTDRMSINYREFPDRIRRLFGSIVEEEKDLDHWHYDMMGQTMLIRNAEGDYAPAHRSLLEFFVAYKFAAELGVLADDFVHPVRCSEEFQSFVRKSNCTWTQYCLSRAEGSRISVDRFIPETVQVLNQSIGEAPLAKAVLDLLTPMISKENGVNEILYSLISKTKDKATEEVGLLCGNIINIMINRDSTSLEARDLSGCVIVGADFSNASLRKTNLSDALVQKSSFLEPLCTVLDVKFSVDSKLIAAATARGYIRLWNVASGTQTTTLKGHMSWIRSILFTPDGRHLISAGDDRTIRVWDLATATCERILKGHIGRVRSLCLSPDSQCVVSAGIAKASGVIEDDDRDYEVVVKKWEIGSGECVQILRGHTDWILSVDYSSDSTKIATGCNDSTVKLWNAITGECIQTINYHLDRVNAVAFDKRSKILASGGGGKVVVLHDLESNQVLYRLEGHTDSVRSLCFSPDNRLLLSGSYDGTIRVWNVSTGKCMRIIVAHDNWVRSVSFSPDGQYVASGSDDQTIKLWQVDSGQCLRTLKGYAHVFLSLEVHPDGLCFATGSMDSTVRIWDIETGACTKSFKTDSAWPSYLQFSADGKMVAVPPGGIGAAVTLWDINSGSRVGQSFETKDGRARAILFLNDRQTMISCGNDAKITFWDVESGDCLRTLAGHSRNILSIALSPDESLLASASEDCTIRLWDLREYKTVRLWEAHTSGVWDLSFHPDGRRLASGSRDHTIKIWDITASDDILMLEGHSDRVKSVVFSPDGEYLASGSHDRTIRIWNISNGECVHVLEGHTNWISAIHFVPNSSKLISASEDGTVRIWDIAEATCTDVLEPDRPYEGMNISRTKGISETELTALRALGAVEVG